MPPDRMIARSLRPAAMAGHPAGVEIDQGAPNPMKLTGKTALVTGAAGGSAAAVHSSWPEPGRTSRSMTAIAPTQGEATVADIQGLGRHAALVEGDVFRRPSCESVVERAIAELGRIDIFVSNPAFSRRQDFLEYDPETFARVIEGTLTGGFHMSQLVARHMVARGGGARSSSSRAATSRRRMPAASPTTPPRPG